jgi:hypothetical protein
MVLTTRSAFRPVLLLMGWGGTVPRGPPQGPPTGLRIIVGMKIVSISCYCTHSMGAQLNLSHRSIVLRPRPPTADGTPCSPLVPRRTVVWRLPQ